MAINTYPVAQKKVAVVTGASRGIGLAIVRGLCRTFYGDVYLTAPDADEVTEAVIQLREEGLDPKFYPLDITDQSGVVKFAEFLKNYYGHIDILVNNAAIVFKPESLEAFSTQAEVTCRTNFTGTLTVCRALFPLLRSHARVVNVSSSVSKTAIKMCSNNVRNRLTDSSLTMDELELLIDSYVKATRLGSQVAEGWPVTPYAVSKVGVTVMSFIQQREFLRDPRPDIVVNACCPGFVRTHMNRFRGTDSPDQGADTPLFLATLPLNTTSPRGNYVTDRRVHVWG